ncbi:unnamed protein product [marine sediment metagenome]|uniref:Uncharacterized protein n=1 Tax=marine sediment metagenome TaxID=412755 RepID=X1KKJ3_9ZZZZ
MPKKGQTYGVIIARLDSIDGTLKEIKENSKDTKKKVDDHTTRIVRLESHKEEGERRIGNNFLIWAAIIAAIAGTVASFMMKFV